MKVFTTRYEFTLRIEKNENTVLDVTLGAGATASEIDKATDTIRKLLEDFTPTIKPLEPPTTPGMIIADEYGPVPTASTWEYLAQRTAAQKREHQAGVEAEPEPESAAPATPKKPDGAKGLLRLRCPECGNTFGVFLRECQTEIACKCGHQIDLTAPLARYHFTCPYCEHEGFGKTNLEDPEIEVRCKCGEDVALRGNPDAKEYQN